MEKRIVVVTADTNNGDYVTRQTELTDKNIKFLTVLIKVSEVIKQFKERYKQHHNHNNWGGFRRYQSISVFETYKGDITQEEIGIVQDFFFPQVHEDYGIRTVESIKILTISNEEELV